MIRTTRWSLRVLAMVCSGFFGLAGLAPLHAAPAAGVERPKKVYVTVGPLKSELSLFSQQGSYVERGETYSKYSVSRELRYLPTGAEQGKVPAGGLRATVAGGNGPVELIEVAVAEAADKGVFQMRAESRLVEPAPSSSANPNIATWLFPLNVEASYFEAQEAENSEIEIEEVEVSGVAYFIEAAASWLRSGAGKMLVFAARYKDYPNLSFGDFIGQQGTTSAGSLSAVAAGRSEAEIAAATLSTEAVKELKLSDYAATRFSHYFVDADDELVLVSEDGKLHLKLVLAQ